MTHLKVRKIGNSLGVVLPREVIAHLQVQDGDTLCLLKTSDGGYKLTPYDPEFEQKVAKAEAIMSRYRNTLRKLVE